MISFRVSEYEFDKLKTESESVGVGSVSDYARLNLCGGASPAPPGELEARIHQLDGKVQDLSSHLNRLVSLVERTHDAVVNRSTPVNGDQPVLSNAGD
jgi:hypothetical protein